jgi:hypothetical protein
VSAERQNPSPQHPVIQSELLGDGLVSAGATQVLLYGRELELLIVLRHEKTPKVAVD